MVNFDLFCECGLEGGGVDRKWNISCQLWAQVVCCPTDYAQYTSKIFMGRCLRGSSYMFIITVEPRIMATPFTQPPCYYGHFILGRNLKNPSNMATLLIWSDFCGPWATGLTEFHCNLKLSMLVVCKMFVHVPHEGENKFWAITHKTKFFTVHFRSDVHNLQ